MPNICYYHRADLDGICSAAIVRKFDPTTILVGVDYGDKTILPPPLGTEKIYMVDFSLQPIERMEDFIAWVGAKEFVWIDHHKSALDEAKRIGLDTLPGLREIGKAGCELTWEYFSSDFTPLAVWLLGRYDVWDLKASENVLPFQYAARMEIATPADHIWEHLLAEGAPKATVYDLIGRGQTVLKYVKADSEKYLASCGFETDLDGYSAIGLNRLVGSQGFDGKYDPARHDLMIPFVRMAGKWKVSLYSTKPEVDCSAIAKKYGGGGHKGAAGFTCDELPFKI